MAFFGFHHHHKRQIAVAPTPGERSRGNLRHISPFRKMILSYHTAYTLVVLGVNLYRLYNSIHGVSGYVEENTLEGEGSLRLGEGI